MIILATIPKPKAIHSSSHLQNTINYIQQDFKTNNKLYCQSINVSLDPVMAVEQFGVVQKTYENNNYKKTTKKNIIAHHFTQNFSVDENITPELAMTIATETAEKHFGTDFQIEIATHIDKNHLHNHFIVNSLSLYGKKYLSQGRTLSEIRKISDEVCKGYGLSILDYSKHKNKRRTLTYNNWQDKQKGVSYKDKMKLNIDRAILKSENIAI